MTPPERRLHPRIVPQGFDAVLLAIVSSDPRILAIRARRQDPLRPLPPQRRRPRPPRAQGVGLRIALPRFPPVPHPKEALGVHLDRGDWQASQ